MVYKKDLQQKILRELGITTDSAFDEIKNKKIEEGQSEKEAEISAGKILSAAKGKKGAEKKKEQKNIFQLAKETLEKDGYHEPKFPFPSPHLKSEGLAKIRVGLKLNDKDDILIGIKYAEETANRQMERAKKIRNSEVEKKRKTSIVLEKKSSETMQYLKKLKELIN